MEPKSAQLLKTYIKSHLLDQKLQLETEDVKELIRSINLLIAQDISESNLSVYKDLVELTDVIKTFKSEIRTIFLEENQTTSADELDIVLETTEDAVEQILTCAENIDALSDQTPDDISKKLTAISTGIYEASNFQDINGQRIKKIIKTFRIVESRLAEILKSIESTQADNTPSPQITEQPDRLLNGPQAPGEGPSQEEIDTLLLDTQSQNEITIKN